MEAQRNLQKEVGRGFWSTGPVPGMPYYTPPAQYEVSAQARIKAFQAQQLAAETQKDILVEKQKEIDIVKEVLAAIEAVTAAEEQRGIVAVGQFELRESLWATEAKTEEGRVHEGVENARLLKEAFIEAWTAEAEAEDEAITEGIENARLLYQAWLEEYTKVGNELKLNWDSIGESFSDIWATNMTRMIRDSENAGDAFRNIFQSMADVFVSSVTKMIVEWLVFEQVQGGKKKFLGGGSGIGTAIGWIGSLLGLKEGGVVAGWRPLAGIPGFQSGGIIDRPTLGIVGEGGEKEWIIPESKIGKSGVGNTYVTYETTYKTTVVANDVDSFRRLLTQNKDLLGDISLGAYAESRRFNKVTTR